MYPARPDNRGCVQLLVVADRKTPADWALEGAEVLSVDEQLGLRYQLKGPHWLRHLRVSTHVKPHLGMLSCAPDHIDVAIRPMQMLHSYAKFPARDIAPRGVLTALSLNGVATTRTWLGIIMTS